MRLNTGKSRLLPRLMAACAGGLGLLILAAPADAGRRHYRFYNESFVYSDSFGNLVIESPAGYKRIVVGQGELADETETGSETPDDGFQRSGTYPFPFYSSGGCMHVLKGRGFMYGASTTGYVQLGRRHC